MSTVRIISKLKSEKTDYNNMKVWSGFFFDKKFVVPASSDIDERQGRKQMFLDYRIFLDYDIDLEAIGEVLQTLYPLQKINNIPQIAYAECETGWELGPHVHDNDIALHMTIFLNEQENEGLYIHDTDKDFYKDAVYVKNVYDSCCVFPFTGKEWHGLRGDKIKGTRKLLYIDWMKDGIN